MRLARAGLVVLVLLVVQRCEAPVGYHVMVRNTGYRDVDNVRVAYGNFSDAPGVIPPGIYKRRLDVQEPLPLEAALEWRDADGKLHRQTVKVMPRSQFKGVLIFEIDSANRVDVRTAAPPGRT